MIDENILGIAAGTLTSVSMLPQLIKVLREKNVEDLSWIMILILIFGLSLWVWYGFQKDELPIIFSNAFAILVNISLFICYFLYKNNSDRI
jgi:MtN3 and saliva related transmembrane protein